MTATGRVDCSVSWLLVLPETDVRGSACSAGSDDDQVGVLVLGRLQKHLHGRPITELDAVRDGGRRQRGGPQVLQKVADLLLMPLDGDRLGARGQMLEQPQGMNRHHLRLKRAGEVGRPLHCCEAVG